MLKARPYFGKKQIRSIAELEVGKRYIAMQLEMNNQKKFNIEGSFTVFGIDRAASTCEVGEFKEKFGYSRLVTKGLGFPPVKTIDLRWYSVVPFSRHNLYTIGDGKWCSISYLKKDTDLIKQNLEIAREYSAKRTCTFCLGYGFLAKKGDRCLSCHGQKGKYSTAYNEPGDSPYWVDCEGCAVEKKSTGNQLQDVTCEVCAKAGKILSKPRAVACLYCNGKKKNCFGIPCDYCDQTGIYLTYHLPGKRYKKSLFEKYIARRLKSDNIISKYGLQSKITYLRTRWIWEMTPSKEFPEKLYSQLLRVDTLGALMERNPQLFVTKDDFQKNGALVFSGLHRDQEASWEAFDYKRQGRMPSGIALLKDTQIPEKISSYILSLSKGSGLSSRFHKFKIVSSSWRPSEFDESRVMM